jgi:hypothetical protein
MKFFVTYQQQHHPDKNMKQASSLSVDDYQYSFTNILNHTTSLKQFQKYLQVEYNEPPLQFLQSVTEMITQHRSGKAVNEKVNQIYESFFSQQSKYQVNLSATIMKEVSQHLEQYNQGTMVDVEYIFENAVLSVSGNLENDSFVRFIRSDMWKKFVRKNFKSDQEMEKIAIHRSKLKQIKYTLKDLERGVITGFDIHFTRHMMRDGLLWDLVYTSKGSKYKYFDSLMMFNTNTPLLDEEGEAKFGKLRVFKVTTTLKVSAKEAFEVYSCRQDQIVGESEMFTYFSVSNPDNSSVTTEENIQLYTGLFQLGYNVGWMFRRREMNNCVVAIHIPAHKGYYVIGKPAPRDLVMQGELLNPSAEKGNYIHMHVYSWMMFEEIDEQSCRFIFLSAGNLGGKLAMKDDKLNRYIAMKAGIMAMKKTCKNLSKQIDWYFTNNKPKMDDPAKYIQLLELNSDTGNMFQY